MKCVACSGLGAVSSVGNQDSAPQTSLQATLVEVIPELKLFFSDEDDSGCVKLVIKINQESALNSCMSFCSNLSNSMNKTEIFLNGIVSVYNHLGRVDGSTASINFFGCFVIADFTIIQLHQRRVLRYLNRLKCV